MPSIFFVWSLVLRCQSWISLLIHGTSCDSVAYGDICGDCLPSVWNKSFLSKCKQPSDLLYDLFNWVMENAARLKLIITKIIIKTNNCDYMYMFVYKSVTFDSIVPLESSKFFKCSMHPTSSSAPRVRPQVGPACSRQDMARPFNVGGARSAEHVFSIQTTTNVSHEHVFCSLDKL